jgi:hypothetical protein
VYPIRETALLQGRFAGPVLRAVAAALPALVLWAPAPSSGQGAGRRPAFIPSGDDDYRNLLDQPGIKKVRPGRNARGKDASDEATANRSKDSMPDLMTFKGGNEVKAADQWPRRRAEIVEDFEREVSGRVPRNVPPVTWEVSNTAAGERGGVATVTRALDHLHHDDHHASAAPAAGGPPAAP